MAPEKRRTWRLLLSAAAIGLAALSSLVTPEELLAQPQRPSTANTRGETTESSARGRSWKQHIPVIVVSTATSTPAPTRTLVPQSTPTAAPTSTLVPQSTPTAAPTSTPLPPAAVPAGKAYYVATNGNDANPGTITQPWLTLQKAANVVAPGQTVYLRGGVYKQYTSINLSGLAGQPITFSAYPGEKVTLDGSLVAPYPADPWSGGRMGILNVHANYLVIQGLELANSSTQGVVLFGDYNTLDGLRVHHNYMGGIGGSGSHNTYLNSSFYDNNGDPGNSDGLAISSGSYNTIRGCEAYRNGDDGFDMWRSKNNILEYNKSYDNGWGPSGTGDGNGFKLGGSVTSGGVTVTDGGYNTARFNLAYNNRQTGFDTNFGANNMITNNTAYGNGWVDFRNFGHSNTFYNNISHGNRNSLTDAYVSQQNSWDLGIGDCRFASVDPASSMFLTLTPTSPCIDEGRNVGSAYNGAAPDLGAFEYGTTW